MALTTKMVASEILMCGLKFGLKQIPVIGHPAAEVIDNLQKKHDSLSNAALLAQFETQLSRTERAMRETVEEEIRTILANLGRPAVPGPELTREMTELRQIYDQGWAPNLFEGLLRNSTHWQELRRNPKQYGRILGDHEPVIPENGIHLLLDQDKTRILEMPASSLAFLLGNQSIGVPLAEMHSAQDIWAFPTRSEKAVSSLDKPGLQHSVSRPVMVHITYVSGWVGIGPDITLNIFLDGDRLGDGTLRTGFVFDANSTIGSHVLFLKGTRFISHKIPFETPNVGSYRLQINYDKLALRWSPWSHSLRQE